MTPNEVNSENEQHLLDTVYNYKRVLPAKKIRRIAKFKVGDHVRMSKYRTTFEKGYTPNWTNEIFKIRKVQYHTNPITYLLSDYRNQEITGSVYTEELQAVKQPNVYLIEKIAGRRKKGGVKQVKAKWLGLGPQHNTWIDETDIIE